MGKRIGYKKGDVIGNYGVVFLEETGPFILLNGKKKRRAKFLCHCDSEFNAVISQVKSDNTKSCGCLKIKIHKVHGFSRHKLYQTWSGIRGRCLNNKDKDFYNYGGRGITMCDEWKNNPKIFVDYISKLEHCGEPGYTLDRYPDNNGNYEPRNVRWATKHTQVANRGKMKNNTSGYVGVSLNKNNNKWRSSITVDGCRIYFQYHETPENAVIPRDNYIIENNLTEYKIQVVKKTTK